MIERLSAEHQIVLRCIHAAIVGNGNEKQIPAFATGTEDWGLVLKLAGDHGVRPLVYDGLCVLDLPVPVKVRDVLHQSVIIGAIAVRGRLETTIRRAVQALIERGLDPIVLKGAALAYTAYPEPRQRTLGDVDLLLVEEDLQAASDTLLAAGFVVTGAARAAHLPGHHHLPVHQCVDTGMGVELHHHLIVPPNPYNLNVGRVRERSVRRTVGNVEIRVLSSEDALHHACVHMAHGHRYEFHPLRGLADILAILSRAKNEFDWTTFLVSVKQSNTAGAVYWPLRMAEHWLGAPIPDGALEDIAPPKPIRQIIGDFAEPSFVLDGLRPKGAGSDVLYTLLRDLSLTTGCSIRTQFGTLRRSLFPSPEQMGHLPSPGISRIGYASVLASPRRLRRGAVAIARLVARGPENRTSLL